MSCADEVLIVESLQRLQRALVADLALVERVAQLGKSVLHEELGSDPKGSGEDLECALAWMLVTSGQLPEVSVRQAAAGRIGAPGFRRERPEAEAGVRHQRSQGDRERFVADASIVVPHSHEG